MSTLAKCCQEGVPSHTRWTERGRSHTQSIIPNSTLRMHGLVPIDYESSLSLVSEHFNSFLKYKTVEELIQEAALIDFAGKHLVNVTGKVKSVFPDGEFQIDLSKLTNISTARYEHYFGFNRY